MGVRAQQTYHNSRMRGKHFLIAGNLSGLNGLALLQALAVNGNTLLLEQGWPFSSSGLLQRIYPLRPYPYPRRRRLRATTAWAGPRS